MLKIKFKTENEESIKNYKNCIISWKSETTLSQTRYLGH